MITSGLILSWLANTGFTIVFALEAVFKIAIMKKFYFHSLSNRFDLTLVVGSIADLISFTLTKSQTGMIVSIGRLFRVLRVVRLIKGIEITKRIMVTLVSIVPSLGNLCLLLLLALSIFGVIGVQMFAKTQFNELYEERANFRSLPLAMLTLLRFMAGERWDLFMYDASAHLPGCVWDPPYNTSYCGFSDHPGCIPLNGCGSTFVFPYLLLYTFAVTLCLRSIFVGVVIDGLLTIYIFLHLRFIFFYN